MGSKNTQYREREHWKTPSVVRARKRALYGRGTTTGGGRRGMLVKDEDENVGNRQLYTWGSVSNRCSRRHRKVGQRRKSIFVNQSS